MNGRHGRILAAAHVACALASVGVSPQGDVLLFRYPRLGGLLQGLAGDVLILRPVAFDGGNVPTIPDGSAVGMPVGLGQKECLDATGRVAGLPGVR